jgi:hypothetical protein
MMGNTLYEQFHNNVKGIAPLNTAKDSLDRLQATYENVRDNMTQALSGIKATYTGNAADAMADAFTPVANSFNDGANFAGSASLATSFQAESFATAQAKIQNQVPVPDAPWYEPVDPFNTDHDDAIQQNSQIDAANEAAYTAYGNDTNGNLGYVQPAPTNTSGFGSFSVTQQGNGTTVGSPSGSSGARGAGGSGSGGPASRYRGTGTGPSGYVAPPSGPPSSSGSSNPGGGGSTSPGQTSTSSYTPPPSTGLGSGPGGGGAPGGGGPTGSPGGTGGGQFGSNGPGAVMGPVGGSGGSFGGGAVGGGSGSSIGRGGFGLTGGSEPGASGSGAPGARSSVGGTADVANEAEMEGGVGAAGRSGASGMPGAMGGRGRGEEDREHRTASYLTNDDNFNLIIGDFDPVAPPVIGEE